MKIDKSKMFANNPRKITAEELARLEEHLNELGDLSGVIYCRNNKAYVGGNQRSKIFDGAEIEIIEEYAEPTDTKTIAHGYILYNGDKYAYREVLFTEEEFRKACIVANNDGGEFDWEELAAWDTDALEAWGMELPEGAFEEELEATEDDYEPPDEIETDIKLGDLFQIGEHRLLCGDSTDAEQVARLMNGEKADMVFTDPPYGVDYSGRGKTTNVKIENDNLNLEDTRQMILSALTNAYIFSKDGCTIFVWHADSKEGLRPLFEESFIKSGWGLHATIIWSKKQASMGFADYRSQHEPCLYGWKGTKKERVSDRTQTTIWEGSRDTNYQHPTQKPLFLCETAINNHSPNLLMDLFLGSGSTMVASHQLNRKCYGMEIDPKYCQVIIDRMKKLDPDITIKKL